MDSVSSRLNAYLAHKGLTAKDFEAMTGLGNGTCAKISEKTRDKTFNRISIGCKDLNIEWLRYGKGDMIKPYIENEAVASPVVNDKVGIPYYDEDFVLGFTEIGFPFSEKPTALINMPKYPNATLWCNATGDSMVPEITSGDVVALQLIEDHSFLIYGDVYAIVTCNGLRTIKRLGRSDDPTCYRLIPTNKSYDEQDIPKTAILRVFRVLGSLHSF